MKCLRCGSEVSMWATVCPYCHRNPGNILEHIIHGIFKWALIFSVIVYGIGFLFSGNSSDKSTQPVKEQSVKTQHQSTEKTKQNKKINYIENTEYENKQQKQRQEEERRQQEAQRRQQEELKKQQEELKKQQEEQERYNNSPEGRYNNAQEDLF